MTTAKRRAIRRASHLRRAAIQRRRCAAIGADLRTQFIAAGVEPAPRWGGRTGRELIRYLSELGRSCREVSRIILPEFIRSRHYRPAVSPVTRRRQGRRQRVITQSLDHVTAAARTGPPAGTWRTGPPAGTWRIASRSEALLVCP
jgi:hypothetical protein